MKKLLSLILVTMLCVCALASCAVVDTVKGWFGQEEEPGEVIEYNLPAAVEYLRTMYIDGATVTPNDYELVAQVMIKAVKYTVDWSVDNDKVKLTKGETSWTVDVDNFAEEAHDYTLSATITAGDGTKDSTLTFKRTVPKYEVLTYEEFLAVEDGEAVTVNGVVTGIVETSKENDLYIQDEDGGYFIFAMEQLPSELGLQNGMTVSVTGLRGTYYGLPQVTEPVVTIMDSTIKTVEPIDITEYFAAAEANVDTHFSQYFSMLVTIKGVKVLGQDSSNNSYYNFSLAGKQSYVRISSSTCMLSADAQTVFQNNVASHINWEADVVGLVANYGNKMYLVPINENAFGNFVEVTVSDTEKVDYELGKLTFDANISKDGAVTVPVKGGLYSDVVISWASDNACAVVDNTAGTITFTRPESATTVKLTATLTLGEQITKTKEFTVKVDGSVLDGTANLTKENMGLGGYADGTVTVEGIEFGYTELGGYSNGIQMRKNSSDATKFSTIFNTNALPFGIKKIVFVYNADKTPRIEDMLSIAFGNDATDFAYTATLTGVDGTMTYEIVPDVATYKFFKISHTASGSLYFDEINIVLDKPVEEHTCEFSQATCEKKATCSICGETQGDFADHIIDEESHICTVCGKDDPDYIWEMTIAEALAAPVGRKVKITGTISEIKSAWNEQFGNMEAWLADADNAEVKILLYRIKTQVEVDDKVIVTGIITAYNNVNQIDGSKSTVECDHTWNDATCLLPKTCSQCGTTEGEALDHDFGENDDAPDCLRDGCDVKNPAIHVCGEFVLVETVAPTCTTVGYDIYGCPDETCPLTENRNEVPATGHKDTDGDYKCDNGTCDELALPAADSVLTVEEAVKICNLFAHNNFTTDKYYVTTTIEEVTNTTHGNMNLAGGLVTYSAYDATGTTKYGSMSAKPGAGDTVTLYGILGKYNSALQMKNAWIIEYTVHTCDYSVAATCTSAAKCSLCGAVDPNGQPIAHTYSVAATCTAPAKCECGAEDPDNPALGHTEANAEGKCDRCGTDVSNDGGSSEEPAVVVYNLASTGTDNTTYYFAGTASGGKGVITTDKAAAAAVYKEDVEGGFYLYILNNGTKTYINIGTSSKAFTLTTTAQLLVQNTSYNTIQDSATDGRGLALYHTNGVPTDIRTYTCTNSNFSSNTGFALVAVE